MYNYILFFAVLASFGKEFWEGNSCSVKYFFVGTGKIAKSICFFLKSSGNNSELWLLFRYGIFRFPAERFFVKILLLPYSDRLRRRKCKIRWSGSGFRSKKCFYRFYV